MTIGSDNFTRGKLNGWTRMTEYDAEYHADTNASLRFMLAATIMKNMLLNHTQATGRKPQDIQVLDVGCGWGKVTIPLHDAGFQVVGTDISPAMIALLHNKKGKRDIPASVCDITQASPEELGTYDIIVMSQVLVHYKNSWEEFLTSVSRFLKPKGCLVFEMRNFEFLQNMGCMLNQRPDQFYRYCNNIMSPNTDGSHLHHGLHRQEMETFAAKQGFSLTDCRQLHPVFSHFFTVGILQEKQADFFKTYDKFCSSPQVIAFLQWLQGSFEHQLPPSMAEETFYLLEKAN